MSNSMFPLNSSLRLRLEYKDSFLEWYLHCRYFDRIVAFLNKLFFEQCDEKYSWLREKNKFDVFDNESDDSLTF